MKQLVHMLLVFMAMHQKPMMMLKIMVDIFVHRVDGVREYMGVEKLECMEMVELPECMEMVELSECMGMEL